jgi:hypothetical protein
MRTTIGMDAPQRYPLLRRVVDELIEPGRDEVVELHFRDRTLAGDGRADGDAEDRVFRYW